MIYRKPRKKIKTTNYTVIKTSYFILITSLFIACQPDVNTENIPFNKLTKHIDHYAQSTIERGSINALAVAVYKNGKSYHNYYGEMRINQANQPNDSTLFEVASISKVFVGSLMARAVADNKVKLDEDIRNYLPFEYPNLEFEGTPISIRNLVTHTLGFETPPKLDSVFQLIFDGYYHTREIDYNMDSLFIELQAVNLIAKPGTYFDYNNVGPEISAYILEKVYEMPYQELLQEFFNELALNHTYLQNYDKHKKHLTHSYDEEGNTASIDKNPLLGGASGIITCLPDLIKFMEYQLNSKDELIQESVKTLYHDDEEELGYFWNVGTASREGFYYFKTGTSNGVQSGLLVCPDSDYGQIIIMNNTSDAAFDAWESLYNKIEYDLIRFPKINLWTEIEPVFFTSPKRASQEFIKLKKDTGTYFASSSYLNNIGYDYLFNLEVNKAITVFKLAIEIDPNNANLYDSLGEAFFVNEEYKKATLNLKKSLELNPENKNAEKLILKIDSIMALN